MAWLITDPVITATRMLAFVPWWIKDGEKEEIPECRQMAVNDELVIDGILVIHENARLKIDL